jgi:hypothetical protein
MGEKLDLTYCHTALFQRRNQPTRDPAPNDSAETLH